MKTKKVCAIIFLVLMVVLSSCSPAGSSGARVRKVDPGANSDFSGLGIGSQEMVEMTDKMVTDILKNRLFSSPPSPPSIIIDDTRLINESSQIFNINMLTDKLRIQLMRASNGNLIFVSRQNQDLAIDEHIGGIKKKAADYRLIGRITSLDSASNSSGVRSSYLVFSFEIIDLSSTHSVWGNLYEVKKAGADDSVYR